MKDALDFSGKVALVTGSSRGIGAGIITALGQLGGRCLVNYLADPEERNKQDAERVAAALPDARVIPCDVGKPEQVGAMQTASRGYFEQPPSPSQALVASHSVGVQVYG